MKKQIKKELTLREVGIGAIGYKMGIQEDILKEKDLYAYNVGFNEGRKQALEEVEKMIDEMIISNPHRGLEWGKGFIYSLEELKSKIKEMEK